MGEIFSILFISALFYMLYRTVLWGYTSFRPQIVQVGELFYIRRLMTPFHWEYAKNHKGPYGNLYFDCHYSVFKTGVETIRSTSNGHKTKEDAKAFLDAHILKKSSKVKVQRVDGLWYMCKNTISKVKFRRNK